MYILYDIREIIICKYTKHRANISCKESIQQLLKKKLQPPKLSQQSWH